MIRTTNGPSAILIIRNIHSKRFRNIRLLKYVRRPHNDKGKKWATAILNNEKYS